MLKYMEWLLDWLGRAQTVQWIWAAVAGGALSGVVATLSAAPLYALVLLFFAPALLLLGIVTAWQNYRLSHSIPARMPQLGDQDTLEILFDDVIGQRYYTWEIERENGQKVSVQRKSILLVNHARKDLENVIVKIEQIIAEDEQEPSSYLGYELHLDQNATRIRRDDSAWVPVFSYRKDRTPGWFSIEGIDTDESNKKGKIFRPHTKREVHLMVRADGGVETSVIFLVQVDDVGCFNMKRLTSTTLNSLKPQAQTAEFTSMKDAARNFYEAARAGKIPNAEGSEKLSGWSGNSIISGSPEDILHWWAGHISKEVPVYGRRPPSSLLEELPARLVRSFIFSDEATKLRDPMNDSVYYTDLCVKSEALEAQYHFEAGFHGSN